MRDVVRELVDAATVSVVSGRDVEFVRSQVRVDGVIYAGSHGFDIVGPVDMESDTLSHFETFLPELDAAEQGLAKGLSDIDGARVERKKYSVATHYRQVAADDVARVTAVVEEVLADHPSLRKGLGKKVFEIRPDIDWHKGRAVRWLFDGLGLDPSRAVPFYVGDDITDEDAFEALAGLGLGIVVGEADRASSAQYRVHDTEEVAAFLAAMAALARGERE
jgi:trehalose-phosphatase